MIFINDKENTVTGIILAAGNSVRYGKGTNKNFEIVENGNSVLSYSLNALNNNKYIDDIIIAAKKDEINKVEEIIKKSNILKKVIVISGGKDREESAYNCITSTSSDIVIIQDGARPLIKDEYINKCLENIKEFDGVTIGVKAIDTIKITDEDGIVINTTKRNNTWNIQTPQCFKRDILLKVHNKYSKEDVTDDCMLLEKGNYKVKVIKGDYTNIKVTTREDLKIIKALIK